MVKNLKSLGICFGDNFCTYCSNDCNHDLVIKERKLYLVGRSIVSLSLQFFPVEYEFEGKEKYVINWNNVLFNFLSIIINLFKWQKGRGLSKRWPD